MKEEKIKTTVEVDKMLWRELKAQAALAGMKITEYLEKILKEGLILNKKEEKGV